LLLRIRSAHLGIFGFLKEFADLWKKLILAKVIRIQKRELGVTAHFSPAVAIRRPLVYKLGWGFYPSLALVQSSGFVSANTVFVNFRLIHLTLPKAKNE